MSERKYKVIIVDEETGDRVFEHHFDCINGKLRFLPSTNHMAGKVKEHYERESEFDPK